MITAKDNTPCLTPDEYFTWEATQLTFLDRLGCPSETYQVFYFYHVNEHL